MSTHLRTLPTLLVAAGCLVIGTSAGAVAAAQITSAQIKDGTITSQDIKNRTLQVKDMAPAAVAALQGQPGPAGPVGPVGPAGTSGVLGREEVSTVQALAANTPKSELTATCPAGKVAIGGAAFWSSSSEAVQFTVNLSTVRAFTPGIPTADTLNVRAICVNG